MPWTSWLLPGTTAQGNDALIDWSNVSNISSYEGPGENPTTSAASVSLNKNDISEWLEATNFSWPTLPTNAILTGVQFEVVRRASGTSVSDEIAETISATTPSGDIGAAGSYATGNSEAVYYGSDTLDLNVVAADLDSSFGFRLKTTSGLDTRTAYIASIRARYYYAFAYPGSTETEPIDGTMAVAMPSGKRYGATENLLGAFVTSVLANGDSVNTGEAGLSVGLLVDGYETYNIASKVYADTGGNRVYAYRYAENDTASTYNVINQFNLNTATTILGNVNLTTMDAAQWNSEQRSNASMIGTLGILHFMQNTGTPTADYEIYNPISNMDIGSTTAPSGSGTSTISGLSFQPDLVIFLYNAVTSLGSVTANSLVEIGFAADSNSGDIEQGSVYWTQNDNTGSNSSGSSTSAVWSSQETGAVTSFTSDGFTVSHTSGGSRIFGWAAIKMATNWYPSVKSISQASPSASTDYDKTFDLNGGGAAAAIILTENSYSGQSGINIGLWDGFDDDQLVVGAMSDSFAAEDGADFHRSGYVVAELDTSSAIQNRASVKADTANVLTFTSAGTTGWTGVGLVLGYSGSTSVTIEETGFAITVGLGDETVSLPVAVTETGFQLSVGLGDETAEVTQYVMPNADLTDGGWTRDTGSNVDLYAAIDENPSSDADYIQSSSSPSTDTAEVHLSNPGTPAVDTGHSLSYRIRKELNLGQVDLTIRLMQGGTEIASWTHTDISSTIVEFTQTLSTAEAAAITNYSDLRLRFEANQVS